jgi:AraC-like DNA-binding protein
MQENITKRGYLKEDFHLFHIKDKKEMEFQYHSHDFHKIVMFISGGVTYHIEGKAYKLQPGDILLVGNTEIHMPKIDPDKVYERFVLWVYPGFLERNNTSDTNLFQCFQKAKENQQHLIRLDDTSIAAVTGIFDRLEKALSSNEYGKDVFSKAIFIQLMVIINRLYAKTGSELEDNCYDEIVREIINFIVDNIHQELSIDSIASTFFMSRYALMHKFKQETGSTIYDYVIKKRLAMAKLLIRNGMQISQIPHECGFSDYSSFERAFKKNIGISPREYNKSIQVEFMDT